MLYTVVEYDNSLRLGFGFPASMGGDFPENETLLNAHTIPLYSEKNLIAGETYSFIPKDGWHQGYFVRGELDYDRPRP